MRNLIYNQIFIKKKTEQVWKYHWCDCNFRTFCRNNLWSIFRVSTFCTFKNYVVMKKSNGKITTSIAWSCSTSLQWEKEWILSSLKTIEKRKSPRCSFVFVFGISSNLSAWFLPSTSVVFSVHCSDFWFVWANGTFREIVPRESERTWSDCVIIDILKRWYCRY